MNNLSQLKTEVENGCKKLMQGKNHQMIVMEANCGNIINHNLYLCDKCQSKLQTIIQIQKMIEEKIASYDKYPSDVFPFMDKLQLRKIDVFMKETFGFPLDRLSAHLMRLAQENMKKELKHSTLGDKS